jgi:hypothetical protein
MVQALPEEVPEPGSSGSISVTLKPFFCSHNAQLQPTIPAPTTAIWVCEFKRLDSGDQEDNDSLCKRPVIR